MTLYRYLEKVKIKVYFRDLEYGTNAFLQDLGSKTVDAGSFVNVLDEYPSNTNVPSGYAYVTADGIRSVTENGVILNRYWQKKNISVTVIDIDGEIGSGKEYADDPERKLGETSKECNEGDALSVSQDDGEVKDNGSSFIDAAAYDTYEYRGSDQDTRRKTG